LTGRPSDNLAISFAGGGQKAEAIPENEQLDKTEKMKLLWKTRLEENRAAVAIQLGGNGPRS